MRSTQSEERAQKANREIEKAFALGQEVGISWLKGAFHTHQSQIAHLLDDLKELRALYLARLKPGLSVREAQLLKVCRVCLLPSDVSVSGTGLILNYGKEHAHAACLEEERVAKEESNYISREVEKNEVPDIVFSPPDKPVPRLPKSNPEGDLVWLFQKVRELAHSLPLDERRRFGNLCMETSGPCFCASHLFKRSEMRWATDTEVANTLEVLRKAVGELDEKLMVTFVQTCRDTAGPCFCGGHVADPAWYDPEQLVGKYIKVEYDPNYVGGYYSSVGRFAYVPALLAKQKGSVEEAFQHHTKFHRQHIIHYSPDELYNDKGERLGD